MPTPARVIVLVSRFDHASCSKFSCKLLLLLLMMIMIKITQRYDHMMKKSQHNACRYDEHWRPVSVHCSPCNFPFTHIIHFESLQVDGLVDMLERILAKKPRCDSSNFSFPYLTAFYFFDTRLKRDFSWRSSAKRSLEAYQGFFLTWILNMIIWQAGEKMLPGVNFPARI